MFPGGHRSRVTPVPIPNTEVKPATADGTAWETVWESRSLPAVIRGRDDFISALRFFQRPRRVRHTVSHGSHRRRSRRQRREAAPGEQRAAWETWCGRERLRPRRASVASRAAAIEGGAPRAVQERSLAAVIQRKTPDSVGRFCLYSDGRAAGKSALKSRS